MQNTGALSPVFCYVLHSLPACAALGIHNLNPLGLQFVPDPVRLGEVLGLLGLVPLEHQGVDGRVALAGDGVAALRRGGLGLGGLRAGRSQTPQHDGY